MQNKTMLKTPIGEVSWFSLDKVDKFANYTAKLKLEAGVETEQFVAKIDNIHVSGKLPYEREADGSVTLKLKVKSTGNKKDGTTYQINPPVIYSNLGTSLSTMEIAKLNVGNGSKIRAKVEVSAYDFMGQQGTSMKPKSVQLVTIIGFNGGEAADLGFDAMEMAHVDDVDTAHDSGDF